MILLQKNINKSYYLTIKGLNRMSKWILCCCTIFFRF